MKIRQNLSVYLSHCRGVSALKLGERCCLERLSRLLSESAIDAFAKVFVSPIPIQISNDSRARRFAYSSFSRTYHSAMWTKTSESTLQGESQSSHSTLNVALTDLVGCRQLWRSS